MKVYLAKKFKEDFSDRELIEEITRALGQSGIEAVSMARDFEKWGAVRYSPADLMRISFEQIDACDAVLVELTEKGVGVGIEAGYAHAKNIPVYVVARSGSDISSTLKGIAKEVVFYNEPKQLADMLSQNEQLKFSHA